MDLVLWRLTEVEDAAGGLADFERRLTKRGEEQARMMARWLLERVPGKLRVLASPSHRTQMMAQVLGLPFEIEPRIGVGADAADLLAAAAWPDYEGATLVFGHKHTLGRAAALLISGKEALWNIGKGGLWWISGRVGERGTEAFLRAAVDPRFIEGKKRKLSMNVSSGISKMDFGRAAP